MAGSSTGGAAPTAASIRNQIGMQGGTGTSVLAKPISAPLPSSMQTSLPVSSGMTSLQRHMGYTQADVDRMRAENQARWANIRPEEQRAISSQLSGSNNTAPSFNMASGPIADAQSNQLSYNDQTGQWGYYGGFAGFTPASQAQLSAAGINANTPAPAKSSWTHQEIMNKTGMSSAQVSNMDYSQIQQIMSGGSQPQNQQPAASTGKGGSTGVQPMGGSTAGGMATSPTQRIGDIGQRLGNVGGNMVQGAQTTAASGGKGGGTQQPVAAPQQPQAPNIFQTAAGGINDAMAAARAGTQYQPMNVQYNGYNPAAASAQGYNPSAAGYTGFNAAGVDSRGYNAAQGQATGYNAANAGYQGFNAAGVDSRGYTAERTGSQGYNAERAGSQGYNAALSRFSPNVQAQQVQAGQIASTDLGAYMNPYTGQVIDTTMSDIERSRQLAANQTAAAAQKAGAFGGSRQAVMEAESNRNYLQQAAQTAAQLRQAGFQNAQQMAGQDIASRMQAGLANQGAALQAGTTNAQLGMQQALANMGAQNQASQFGAQAANVAALQNAQLGSQANQFGAAAANQASLANMAAANQAAQFGASAYNQAQQQASAQQQAASQFGASAANQAALANQAAQNQAAQFGASAQNQQSLANQAALNQASQFGASAYNQAQQQASAQQQAANQFGASAFNQSQLANAAAANQAAQFGAGAQNTASLANAAAQNQAGQYNAGQSLQAQLANQQAGLSGAGQRLSAASQLGNLANIGFGMGQDINQQQMLQGAMQQQLQQQLIDAAKAQYGGYTGAPSQSLGLLLQAMGVAPSPTTTTQSKQPGLFDYLTLGLASRG